MPAAEPPAGDRAHTGGDDRARIASRPVYDGRIVHLAIDTVRFPDGSQGEMEMIRHSGAAAVLPVLDHDDDPTILLLRQYRYAAGGELIEVPAGRPEAPGEPWEDCARRELEEETGLRAGRLVPIGSIFTTPGFTDEHIHLFLAFDCTDGQLNRDPDEFMELLRLRLSEALDLARSGRLSDAKTLCTLFLAGQHLRGG